MDINLHFFHANFTTTIYGQNLHYYLILARSRDVIEHNFFNSPVMHPQNFKRLCMVVESSPMFTGEFCASLLTYW